MHFTITTEKSVNNIQERMRNSGADTSLKITLDHIL